MKTLFQELNRKLQENQNTVLVSTIASAGSTPRGAGAHMLVDCDGRVCGTVGGGAIEGKCIQIAKRILNDKSHFVQRFSLNDMKDEELGMVCGGDVTIFFQHISSEKAELIKKTNELFDAGKKAWLLMNLSKGDFSVYSEGVVYGNSVPLELLKQLDVRPQIVEIDEKQFYAELMIRSGRVYIFGGGHVAQALVPVLSSVEFRCVVLEDREEFCNPQLFPKAEEVRLLHDHQWREQLSIGTEDYICIMTRGHKSDLECQVFALETDACYIGVIGSRRKIAATQEKLKERGYTEHDFDRITTPIGLSIGAQTPAEIAVSIAAQLIEHRAKRISG